MDRGRQLIGEKRQAVGFDRLGRFAHDVRPAQHHAHQLELPLGVESRQRGLGARAGAKGEDVSKPSMGVLRVVDRVFARLSPRQVDIKLHLRIGRAQEKEVAHGIGADIVEHFLQGDTDTGAPRHSHGFLAALHGNQLDQ